MSSTHDAFSIPNHSPTFMNRSLSPDQPNSGNSQDYSYPPASSPGYPPPRHEGATSPPAGQRSSNDARRGEPTLPMHNSSRSAYPSLDQSWTRIQAWLARNYPELGDTLNYGILPQDLHEIQFRLGFPLPQTIRDSYLRVDGQEAESSAGCSEGLFFGLNLLALEDVVEEWKFWREVDDDPSTGANPMLQERMKSIPSGFVRPEYSNRGWIPLATDRVGNYLGVDINPGEKGSPGQVIVFGRDFDTKVVLWRGDGEAGWAKWLANFAEELESGDIYEVGNQDTNSEGSEDSIGHEPYFFDGSANGNRGQGGGDGGAVGIRLNGEYKGWNILEALADRSVKKWKEAGVVTEEEYPTVDPRKTSLLSGLRPLSQDTGVEVPIPLLDEGASSLDDQGRPLPSEPETPRARAHVPSKPSLHRPTPMPIALPTRSDIVSDIASNIDENELRVPGPDGDLERGERLTPGLNGAGMASPPGSAFTPRQSGEDTELLKSINVEPPTPVTMDSAGDVITLPHKRRSPSPVEDLLNDEETPLPQVPGKDPLSSPKTSQPNGTPMETSTSEGTVKQSIAAA